MSLVPIFGWKGGNIYGKSLENPLSLIDIFLSEQNPINSLFQDATVSTVY